MFCKTYISSDLAIIGDTFSNGISPFMTHKGDMCSITMCPMSRVHKTITSLILLAKKPNQLTSESDRLTEKCIF
jgi:hypothetical protein